LLSKVRSGEDFLGHVMSSYATLVEFITGKLILCQVSPVYDKLGQVIPD
jgi:hypothetical protein